SDTLPPPKSARPAPKPPAPPPTPHAAAPATVAKTIVEDHVEVMLDDAEVTPARPPATASAPPQPTAPAAPTSPIAGANTSPGAGSCPDQPEEHRGWGEAPDRAPVQAPGGHRAARPFQLRDRLRAARRSRSEDGRTDLLAAEDLLAGAGGSEGPGGALARQGDLACGDHRSRVLQRQPATSRARGRCAGRPGRGADRQ